ncbi:MAG: hypothetical protein Q9195_000840 [Heterodermia aff. obscurata]
MPRGGFEEDSGNFGGPSRTNTRKPRNDDDKYGSSRHRRGSDDDSRERGKGMEVARRHKSKKYSDSEDEEPKKKSKGKSKKSKKRQESSDEDDDDNEMIVTKTAKYKDVEVSELDQPYIDALMKVFEVRIQKVARWCHDGLIRHDNKTGMLDAEKLLDAKANDDERKEWERFEKRYKRVLQESIDRVKAKGYGKVKVVYTHGRSSTALCYQCNMLGYYCGHIG